MTDFAIRPPTLADAADLLAFELENRAWFERWINGRAPDFYSLEGVRDAIACADAARRDDHGYQFLVTSGGRIVGRVNLSQVRRPHFNSAELGYRIGEREAGRGYASEAVRLCLQEAFEALDLWRIESSARPENAASVRVLERNGFVAYGRSRRCLELHGQWWDLLHFERHRESAAGPRT
jgi:ribosomal-protein-alanine N-acetyltransferase